jgi:hypothetical protein
MIERARAPTVIQFSVGRHSARILCTGKSSPTKVKAKRQVRQTFRLVTTGTKRVAEIGEVAAKFTRLQEKSVRGPFE